MIRMLAAFFVICSSSGFVMQQAAPPSPNPLLRHYREGEKLTYHMKGINEAWHYEIQADGVVKKDSAGTYSEEYRWSHLISDGQETALTPANQDLRQEVTLDPNHNPTFPNLSKVGPQIIGPSTDLVTFYTDLWLTTKIGKLVHAGDHFYFKRSTPNSWADGSYVSLGEDSIDFDFMLEEVSPSDNTATLLVRHVPPEKPEIRLPADWMHKPVADTANNWVEVRRAKDGKYLAAVGKESFAVEMKISLKDGKILSGSIDNPVDTVERECEDAALTHCGDPKPHHIHRQIEMLLMQ